MAGLGGDRAGGAADPQSNLPSASTRESYLTESGRIAMRHHLFWIVYLVIGVIVAVDRNYFDQLGSVDRIFSLIFEVLLWPLVLLGVDIRVG
jgi:hypothetical protein